MHGHEFWEWVKQPGVITSTYSVIKVELTSKSDVLAVISAWRITFAIIVIIVLGSGFGPLGVGAGGMSAPFYNRGC